MKYKGAGDPMSYDDVLALVKTYITKEESLALIQKAYDFIMVKHKEQKRRSGEPYTIHLIWVAYILATLQTGPITIAAGLLHDVCKESPTAEQEELMLKSNMNISGAELSTKALWHGPAGAYFIKSELGINDSDILNAVRYHTIGRSGMSKLEEIIYMADLISDDRDYKDVDKMRKLAYSDFERAMYEAVSYSIESVLKKQGYIPECTVNLYNQYSYIYSVHKKNKEKNDGKK